MKDNIFRSDIQLEVEDYKIANIIRALNFENKPYIYKDNKIFENGKEIEMDDNAYAFLDMYYSKLIPLWENQKQNAKKYPDLYNDRKWIVGKRELKRKHQKLLILENGFKFKVGYLWKHQPFEQRPTYTEHRKFVKTFRVIDRENNIIIKNENWGAILAQTQQYIKDNALEYYKDYTKCLLIQGYCKSEDTWFDIVKFNVLKNEWLN